MGKEMNRPTFNRYLNVYALAAVFVLIAGVCIEQWLGPTEDKITPPSCSDGCTKKYDFTLRGKDYMHCICGDGKKENILVE
jgi:hypothetical protein